MPGEYIDFRETGYFSDLICDYLDEKSPLRFCYHRFPSIENFKQQLEEKSDSFSAANRAVLAAALIKQYHKTRTSPETLENLRLLEKDNTFTVATGHQLNLFTGPLYFLYKIVSTINLCRKLKQAYPTYNFVPVYWMATEDHDFDEIAYFNLNGKKFQWNRSHGGAVGELSTEGLESIFELLASEFGGGMNADALKKLFEDAYVGHKNLANATRYLANELFKAYGLVIVDGNDTNLKRLFIPHMQTELLTQSASDHIQETNGSLSTLGYKIQVNPRAINLFYLKPGLRERIVEQDGVYYINETDLKFSKEEILQQLKDHPERFSPNVVMRPLYQEVILPNLCYIGGGGELAYWLQLKSFFDTAKIPFPVLLLRNSVLVLNEKQQQKLDKLEAGYRHLFLKQHDLINRKVREISDIDIDFTPQKEHLKKQFEALYELAGKTDESFLGAVKAQEVKQLKGLNKLEKRLLKAQKRKLEDHVNRIVALQNELFPNGSLQERNLNFSQFYLAYGRQFLETLLAETDPLALKFSIIVLDN